MYNLRCKKQGCFDSVTRKFEFRPSYSYRIKNLSTDGPAHLFKEIKDPIPTEPTNRYRCARYDAFRDVGTDVISEILRINVESKMCNSRSVNPVLNRGFGKIDLEYIVDVNIHDSTGAIVYGFNLVVRRSMDEWNVIVSHGEMFDEPTCNLIWLSHLDETQIEDLFLGEENQSVVSYRKFPNRHSTYKEVALSLNGTKLFSMLATKKIGPVDMSAIDCKIRYVGSTNMLVLSTLSHSREV